jgi:TonB family protein
MAKSVGLELPPAISNARPVLPPSPIELNLLPSQPKRSYKHWARVLSASIALHLIVFALALRIPAPSPVAERPQPHYKRIILYMPPSLMTQKAPNRSQPSKQIDLASLLASQATRRQLPSPPPSRRRFELSGPAPVLHPQAQTPQALPAAPQVTLNIPPAPLPAGSPNSVIPQAPPAPKPAQNQFQDVGVEQPSAHPKLAPPHSAVQAAINGLAQNPNSRHTVVSDDNQSQPLPALPGSIAGNGAPHTAVELQSDPQGIDFRPYLAQILAIVRANWRHVIPESARMGQLRGRTVIEFIVNRDGSIPKLVTAESSGSEPLDRAAVAGLSMSNPLPPLPAGFKGFQVRLAFSFAYNMPAQ